MKKALPIGVDNFKKLVDADYYYVDKTTHRFMIKVYGRTAHGRLSAHRLLWNILLSQGL